MLSLIFEYFVGFNVTIPYKEVAMKYCQPDEIASEIGCVNTLLNKGDKVLSLGENHGGHVTCS